MKKLLFTLVALALSVATMAGNAAPYVIGIQRGTLYSDTYVVCGSHFDSFSWEALMGGIAHGADDNATGVASVLESARIMTQYEFEYSIIYCAYGCEEMGFYGSEAYASRCQQEGKDIIGYFNNDMNGYLCGDLLDLGRCQKGVYFLKATSERRGVTTKIMVQ